MLYLIESTFYSGHFYQIFEAYTAGVRKKPIIQTEILQNSFGATFDNVIATWENAVSTLVLEEFYSGLETSGIVLTLNPLLEIANKRIKDATKDRAKDWAKRL